MATTLQLHDAKQICVNPETKSVSFETTLFMIKINFIKVVAQW